MPDEIRRNLFSPNLSVEDLLDALETWFSGQHMLVVRTTTDEDGGVKEVLFARSKPGWRKAAGLAVAMRVTIAYEDPSLEVHAEVGSFGDKLASGTVGAFGSIAVPVLLPLVATSFAGMVRQSRLPERCVQEIERWLRTRETLREERRATSPIPSARDHADDYRIIKEDPGSPGSSAQQEPTASSGFSEEDLLLSDFEAQEVSSDFEGQAQSQVGARACAICGAATDADAVVCPQGHRIT